MSNGSMAHVAGGSLSVREREQAVDFIESNSNSPLAHLLHRVLAAHDRGVDVDVFSNDAVLTPNQAAEIAKMSRPHLLTFMDRGELSFHKVGTHRRVKLNDLMNFMEARDAGSEMVARALHRPPQTLGAEDTVSSRVADELNDL